MTTREPKKTWRIVLIAVVLCILGWVAARSWSKARDAQVVQELAQRVRSQNAKTAKGLELRLWGNPEGFTAVLRNASGGPMRVYPPVRQLTLFVSLFDRNGQPYEPRSNLAPHTTKTGQEPVPIAPHGATWEEPIRLSELRAEFDNLEGAAYLIARYKLHFREKRDDVANAEVWSNPVRLP